jgi:hypothetical protein
MVVHDVTILVERDEKAANQLNQLYATQNMKHDESIGKISDLNMQNIVVSDCDKAHVLNRLNHTICADLVVSHDHNFAEHLQFDNPCSIIYDLFYALIWLIYMIVCTHISSTVLVNKFGDMERNTHDIIVLAIKHHTNICADLIEEHVDKFYHKIWDDNNICTSVDPCNILYANKNHQFQLISSGEFFAKLSPNNCLFYTMLDTPIDVNKMLENISVITSSRSLNTIHNCKFTFILIGEHVVPNFYVHAICIMSDKLADSKSNMLCDTSCHLYFSNEMNQLLSLNNSEPSMSLPCSSNPLKENTHGKISAICAHEKQLPTYMNIAIEGYTSKLVHNLSNTNFGIVMNVSSPSFEQFDLGMVKFDILNQLCCLHEIFVLPSYKLFAGTQKSIMIFHRGKMKVANTMFQGNNHLWYNRKSRSTVFQGRENDVNIMMIVTYGPTPCSFSFLGNGVLHNKDNDKTNDIFIYHAYTLALLCNHFLGYEKLGVASPQEGKKDQYYICTLEAIIVNRQSKVKAKLKFQLSYFSMAKLLFGLYDYRLKHLGILEEINATTTTYLHLNHFNHEGVVQCPRKKKKILQRKYNATTFLDDGDLAPFSGSIESRTTPYQEEEDDVHIPNLTCMVESRTTPFQEEEDDVHMPRHTYITESRTTPFQEEEDVHMPSHKYITESRTTHFQEEEDDVDIPRVTQDQASDTQATVLQGPITHSHTKKLKQNVNSILAEINFNTSENVILPKCSSLFVLRYIRERGGSTIQREEAKKKNQVVSSDQG